MKRRYFLLFLSLLCLSSAAYLTWREKERYDRQGGEVPNTLPAGSIIAGIPVGGLDAQAAGMRLAQAYLLTPVEGHYEDGIIWFDPQQVGFSLNLEAMLAEAQEGNRLTFWEFLNNRTLPAVTVDLQASLDEARLGDYLRNDVAPRYGKPPTMAQPAAGKVDFLPGQPGETMNVEAAEQSIAKALFSLDRRVVDFSGQPVNALPANFEMLEPMLAALVQTAAFDGTVELYLQDLNTGKEINLAYHQGKPAATGIAFTAASTIKIPVMVSAFRQLNDLPPDVEQQMRLMIDLSDNGSTDEVMKRTMDENLAPLQVTEDMRALGMEDTFLAGMFYLGAPLLQRFETPANQRSDLSTDPDPYNQTTAAEMGRLIGYIEQCAAQGSGPLVEKLREGDKSITQAECQMMIEMLKDNRKGLLIQVGLPDGNPLAHKYGYVLDSLDGLLHATSDVAVVYTPKGNFVLSVYLYASEQLVWDDAQHLTASLATAVSNYYQQLP